MSIAAEIESLVAAKHAIKAAIEAKNPTVAPTDVLAQWPDAIASIPTGGGFPSCLQLVQHVEATGTQHVDTGIVPATSHVVKVRFQTDDYSDSNVSPFVTVIGFMSTAVSYTGGDIRLTIGGKYFGVAADGGWHDAELRLSGNTPSMWLDGTKIGEKTGAFTPPTAAQQNCHFKLFCQSTATGVVTKYGTGKIARFTIEDSETGAAAIDLVPARILTGTGTGPGVFWDAVSGKVYMSGGTDQLVAGPDAE